jgi:hypothetical protein
MADEPTPQEPVATPAQAVEPTVTPPATPSDPTFSAAYDREALTSNLPEGMDPAAFGKYLDKTSDPFVAFKNYSNLEKMKSKGLPNESWTDEDYAALNEARGVPKDPDGYKFSEETALSEEAASKVREIALEGGYDPKQAQKLAEVVQGLESQGKEIQEKQQADATQNMINFLETEWGHPDTKSYSENFALVQDVLAANGIDHESDVSNSIWSGPPQVVKMLNEYAKMMSPTDLPRVNSGDLTTPKSIESKLANIASEMNKVEVGSQAYKELDAEYDRQYRHKVRISG